MRLQVSFSRLLKIHQLVFILPNSSRKFKSHFKFYSLFRVSLYIPSIFLYDDARVQRYKNRSCLHDKGFDLGTRQTFESSDLRSKSANHYKERRFVMAVDFHLHSAFSGDSEAPMEQMILEGIRRGLRTMCFTEHMDLDYPEEPGLFEVNTESYREKFLQMREKYQDQIELLFGIELGLQPHLAETHRNYLNEWPFDFVIGSSHVVHGKDPYYPAFYEGKEEAQAYREYFESILENLADRKSVV